MPLPRNLLDRIHRLALRQAGHVGRWQLLAVGCRQSQADHHPVMMGWHHVHAGVSRLPGVERTRQGDMWAAVLAVVSRRDRDAATRQAVPDDLTDRGIAVTGFSAAWTYGCVDNPPSRTQLLIRHHLKSTMPGIRPIRTRVWPSVLDPRDGLPRTTIIRTLWDCAWILREEPGAVGRLRRMATRADALRLCEAKDLWQVAQAPREYGLPAVVPSVFRGAANSLRAGHSHSGGEHRARQIVAEVAAGFGLAVEPRPFPVADGQGVAGEADIAIPMLKLDIEVDGPHHDRPEQRRKDVRRDARMRRAGWTVRRYPDWLVWEDPEAFRAAVEADIRQAARAQGLTLRTS